jgi:hypothetical protein
MTAKKPAGEGTRFKTLKAKIKAGGKSEKSAEAIAAAIGRKKFGKQDMAAAAAAGHKGKIHRMKKGGK